MGGEGRGGESVGRGRGKEGKGRDVPPTLSSGSASGSSP